MPAARSQQPYAIARSLRSGVDERLATEWLLANGRGGFAMGSVIGCPTRKYHALLLAARKPPLARFNMISQMVEIVRVGGMTFDLSTFERGNGLRPAGYEYLIDFEQHNVSPHPWVEWVYRTPVCDIRKRVVLFTGADLVSVKYTVSCTDEQDVALDIRPAVALRDFHEVRPEDGRPDWDVETSGGRLWIRDRRQPELTLALFGRRPPGEAGGLELFDERAVLGGVRYRVETERGYPDREDLPLVGVFKATGRGRLNMELVAGAFYPHAEAAERAWKAVAGGRGAGLQGREARASSRLRRRLEAAADQFVVHRESASHRGAATILAGYPWFGDWGRDAFIALEGLLLCTGRFAEALEVLGTFASAQRRGLIPNLFDDYGGECHYNSVDASLWFMHAADRYLERSGDRKAWDDFLAIACANVIDAFIAGTDFDIHADVDGLLHAGHERVQITWMDAKRGETVFTPRHGKPVEVNALWHRALRIAARRFAASDASMAERYAVMADQVAAAFRERFWRQDGLGLFDVIREGFEDQAIRPNQIFAVSLPESPLTRDQQRVVLDVVTRELLTPYGLRSLAPGDPSYRGRFEGTMYDRDAAYHQGTVWSWLIGPYTEAWLRTHGFSAEARRHARRCIASLLGHLDHAALGTVSEVFDGDPPHRPGGCVAQAWSVAELIRILEMIE